MRMQDGLALVWIRDQTSSGRARVLREAARLSQAELAAMVGVPSPTVQAWEAGRRRPTGAPALRYARALRQLEGLGSTAVSA